jgi:hypothetical protein
MDCDWLIWHTTRMLQKNVGDSVRAWCMESVHARFGGEGLVLLGNQDLASYPTPTYDRNGLCRPQEWYRQEG